MTNQKASFVGVSKNQIERLEEVLEIMLLESGIKIVPVYGFGSEIPKFDNWEYEFSLKGKGIGRFHYEWDAKNNVYVMSLDLSKMPPGLYAVIDASIKKKMPALFKYSSAA